MPLESPLAALDVGIDIVDGAHVQAGKVACLRSGEQIFRRIQLRRIRRESIGFQPVPLSLEEYFRASCPVRRQPVPEEDHASPDMAAKLLEAADDIGVFDRMRKYPQEQSRPLPFGRTNNDPNDGARSPGTGRRNDRRVSPRRPRPPHRCSLRNTGFVPEGEDCAHSDRFFLIRGQVTFLQ